MRIVIGTVFCGRIKSQGGQYITTKMFCLGIPLFPLDCMLVTKGGFGSSRYGMAIPWHGTSIAASYLRILVLAVGAGIIALASPDIRPLAVLFAVALAGATWFLLGRSSAKERFVRSQFYAVFGIHFLPQWLYQPDFERLFNAAQAQHMALFNDNDWAQRIKTLHPGQEAFPLVYVLSMMDSMVRQDHQLAEVLENKYGEQKAKAA